MTDQNDKTVEQLQKQLLELQVAHSALETLTGCLIRAAARHSPELLSAFEQEVYQQVEKAQQTHQPTADFLAHYLAFLTKTQDYAE